MNEETHSPELLTREIVEGLNEGSQLGLKHRGIKKNGTIDKGEAFFRR